MGVLRIGLGKEDKVEGFARDVSGELRRISPATGPPSRWHAVYLPVRKGETVWLKCFDSFSREVELNGVLSPAADLFDGAEDLGGAEEVSQTRNIRECSAEDGEPFHGGWQPTCSRWWRWTAPRSGRVAVKATAPKGIWMVAVYEGASLHRLHEVASGRDACSFEAEEGREYRIAVDGRLWEKQPGEFRFSLGFRPDRSER